MAEMEILEIEESTNPNKDSKVFINENGVFKQAEIDNLLRNSDTISDVNTSFNNLFYTTAAAFHNSIYRGKNLGSSLTAAQKAAIKAGTFDDMYIGDYWVINGIVWRIAHFDYWLNTGDTQCTNHHILIVPDTCLYNFQMNETNTTAGGYVGSKMYTEGLEQAKTIINNAFGAENILTHREFLTNAVTGNRATGWAWYDSTVENMNESMVFGSPVSSKAVEDSINFNVGIDKCQLALFKLDVSRICNRAHWWLRCVVSAVYFARVSYDGLADAYSASNSIGFRPVFGITA